MSAQQEPATDIPADEEIKKRKEEAVLKWLKESRTDMSALKTFKDTYIFAYYDDDGVDHCITLVAYTPHDLVRWFSAAKNVEANMACTFDEAMRKTRPESRI